VAVGLIFASVGCGSKSVEQKFSDRLGEQVTGCQEQASNAHRTVYQCDNDVIGVITADGKVRIEQATTSLK